MLNISISAGLPNITGALWAFHNLNTYSGAAFRNATGCFMASLFGKTLLTPSSTEPEQNPPISMVDMKASYSSSIYKSDVTTVIPESINVRFYVKY